MDNFTYNYLNIGSNPSNRLGYVNDAVLANSFTDDIDAQNPAGNYNYDELGQLIYDQQELIANIDWRSGDKKIRKLTRAALAGNKPDLEFIYNPMGQRVLKIEKPRINNVLQTRDVWKYTYYAYDANGQVMATYQVNFSNNGLGTNRATLTEQNIYGASRLGMRRKSIALYENTTIPYIIPDVKQNTLGDVAYEITNYLGNVNVVISDRKIYVPTTGAFKACTLSRTDYFPFGMEISSRTNTIVNYRFGYNGMEQDPEAKGEGNSYTTEFRQYDPRIGRWLSLDPLMAQYPMMSPYVAFNNNPIFFVDPLGLEGECPGDDETNCDPGDEPKKKSGDFEPVTVTHKLTSLEKLKIIMNNLKKDLDVEVAQKSNESKENKWLENADLSGFGDGFTTTSPQLRPFDISTRTAFQKNMNSFSTNYGKIVTYSGLAVTSSVALVYAAPTLLAYGSTAGKYTWEGMKLYHKIIGVNGGYANGVLNWMNQSYVQGGHLRNYFSIEGKSLTGLMLASSMGYSSMIFKQAAIGAVDPWANVTYTGKEGLSSKGYLLNFEKNKPSLQKTTTLSLIGTIGPLYGGVPLVNNGTATIFIQQILFTPVQKTVTDVKEKN